ncbi:MAG: ABC transporter ATP-binding protein [Clostridiales bacterium]|jgi:sn-glycerol 3-phosphate transport system ATP-binding protein|nr:ABC transporter ATP-binding protein [Clostridiales bacterium]
MSEIELRNVCKEYKKGYPIIHEMSLTLKEGGFSVLLGPSGCGKSTLLRIIAGLDRETGGDVLIGGKSMKNVLPQDREIAMVFQNYALYPSMTARENMEFGLKNMKIPKNEREIRISRISKMLGLEGHMKSKPHQLSGGQCQRVALARAIVKEPKAFLMDEPLSNLDAKLRAQIRRELIELHNKLGTTFVYVTHDQVEAMSMGSEVIVLEGGKARQQASPDEVYANPADLFVAKFIGAPPMNIVDVSALSTFGVAPKAEFIGFRPEKAMIMDFSATCPDGCVFLAGSVAARENLGDHSLISIKTEAGMIIAKRFGERAFSEEKAMVAVKREDLKWFDEDGKSIRT